MYNYFSKQTEKVENIISLITKNYFIFFTHHTFIFNISLLLYKIINSLTIKLFFSFLFSYKNINLFLKIDSKVLFGSHIQE